MVLIRNLLVGVLVVALWAALVVYGAISGWWLATAAPKGDTAAFFEAAIDMAHEHSRGNVALVLLHDGDVYAEHYEPSVDAVDRHTLFPVASMSKWVTAFGVMQLVQAGKLDLDAPVSRYLTRWTLPVGEFDPGGVTVRRLLSHTAGLTDALGFGDYGADEQIPSLVASLQQPRASSGTAIIVVGQEPGSGWLYSGGGYLIAQLVIEEASGISFSEWMQQSVFDPLGMQRSTYAYLGDQENASRSFDASGQPVPAYRYAAAAATGLLSSTADLTRFAQAQLQGDNKGDHTRPSVPDPTIVRTMRQPLGRMFGADIWGLGVMLYAPTRSGDHVFGHDGSNEPAINTALRINPDNGDAIIVLVTGNPNLATSIAFEWTLWQTGVPDFLMLDRVLSSALVPFVTGLLIMLVMVVLLIWRQRRRENSPA